MRKFFLTSACASIACLAAQPSAGSVMVIGNSPGFSCYAAAKSKSGSADALRRCDEAFRTGSLNFDDEVATYVNRGIVKLHGLDHHGAVADFDRAIALDPAQPESYLNKGAAFVRMGGSTSEAIALFNEALARKTSRPEIAYFSRGVAHEVAGNLTQAYRDYKRAQELAPRWDQPGEELSRFQVTRVSRPKM
jgi:tetratricopeptide (TPR) repeat protein